MRSILELDLSKDGLRLNGAGVSIRGVGQSTKLQNLMSKCFWNGEGCEAFIEEAYTDAAELDEKYPAGRVANLALSASSNKPLDRGNIISLNVKPYSK